MVIDDRLFRFQDRILPGVILEQVVLSAKFNNIVLYLSFEKHIHEVNIHRVKTIPE